jgi:flagellin
MIVNHNISALNANRQIFVTELSMEKSLQRLASGLRINTAGDDAAGLAISERLRSQIKGLDQAKRNAQDAISLLQTAESSMSEITSMLQRLRELSIQSSNDTNTSDDRTLIQTEVDQIILEIDRLSSSASFAGLSLLDGRFSSTQGGQSATVWQGSLVFQVGANKRSSVTDTRNQLSVSIATMNAQALAVNTMSSNGMTSRAAAISAIAVVDAALVTLSTRRATLGAYYNRVEHTVKSLAIEHENVTAAESRIRDVDMATEMMNFTKTQILMQSGTAMLAQANLKPQFVLQLLG